MSETKTEPIKIQADFAALIQATPREKNDLETRSKALAGDRMPFGKLWQDFLDGGSVGETLLVWWFARRDGHPDLTIDDILDAPSGTYELAIADVDEEEGPGEGNAAEAGGSTTSMSSGPSSSSTKAESPETKFSTGTETS